MNYDNRMMCSNLFFLEIVYGRSELLEFLNATPVIGIMDIMK